jgi:predicted DNA-binding protein (MmcQ/YjbR family)
MEHRNAVLKFIEEQYGTIPEYLWVKFPNYAVFRHQENRKWFAILMDVPVRKLGLPGDSTTDVLDIKCDPIMIGSLLNITGFLPAYHMNKFYWISILLNGSVPKEDIFGLLDLSYNLTKKKK